MGGVGGGRGGGGGRWGGGVCARRGEGRSGRGAVAMVIKVLLDPEASFHKMVV